MQYVDELKPVLYRIYIFLNILEKAIKIAVDVVLYLRTNTMSSKGVKRLATCQYIGIHAHKMKTQAVANQRLCCQTDHVEFDQSNASRCAGRKNPAPFIHIIYSRNLTLE